jgi:hypothetical protein
VQEKCLAHFYSQDTGILEPLSLFDHRLRVRLAVVPIPERMADVVAAFDLNRRALLATLLT